VVVVHAALLCGYLFWRTPDAIIGDSRASIELDPIHSTTDGQARPCGGAQRDYRVKGDAASPPEGSGAAEKYSAAAQTGRYHS
jgi:hypothetical protein